MDRRTFFQGLILPGISGVHQNQRKLGKLVRRKIDGKCPVCKSEDVLDKFDAVTPKQRYSMNTLTIATDSAFYGAYTPAAMIEIACGECGTCYLIENPAAK